MSLPRKMARTTPTKAGRKTRKRRNRGRSCFLARPQHPLGSLRDLFDIRDLLA
jgi:hypothetical protein